MGGLRDLAGYARHLAEHRLAPERCIPFCVRWVERYLLMDGADQLGSADQVRLYLEVLSQDSRVADWQLRQAEQAVLMYRQYSEPGPAGAEVQDEWGACRNDSVPLHLWEEVRQSTPICCASWRRGRGVRWMRW